MSWIYTIGTITILAITSWIAVHVFALLGIFIAVGYLIWWFFVPRKTTCFFCQTRKIGEVCFACNRIITQGGNRPVQNFRSLIINGLLILTLSGASFGVVFIESKLLFNMGVIPAKKTASFTIPTKGQYRINEIFPMNIDVAEMQQSINAVQADIGFDPNLLEVYKILKDDSFADVFIQEEVNNQGGFMRLTGGLPNPGFSGKSGHFATILFRTKAQGVVTVKFLPSSMVLANDGQGSNILKDYAEASYLIIPEIMNKSEADKQAESYLQSRVLGTQSKDSPKLILYETNENMFGKLNPDDLILSDNNQERVLPLNILKKVNEVIFIVWGGLISGILILL